MPYRYFEEPKTTHAVDNLKIIYRSFLDDDDMTLAYPAISGTHPDTVREKFKLAGDFYVLVPANSHMHKTGTINHRAWPLDHWCRLFKLLEKENLQAVIIGGEAEQNLFEQHCKLPPNIKDLTGQTSFTELVGLTKAARGVITTDTGPSHIASAVDTPVYALIGPTNYKRTGPYKTEHNVVHILTSNMHCSPCYHTERLLNCKNNECMQRIIPDEVLQKILQDRK